MADEAFEDLLATLRWGAELPLMLLRIWRLENAELCREREKIDG